MVKSNDNSPNQDTGSVSDEPLANHHCTEFQSPTAKDECSSCLAKLQGRYCHICGQVSDEYHRPIWGLFSDIFDGLFGVDGRIWKTIPPLMLHPGKITYAYLGGKRDPYIQPFKLFLLASIIFFLMFALFVRDNENEESILYIETGSPIGDNQKNDPAAYSAEQKVETICHLTGFFVPENLSPECKQVILEDAVKNSNFSLASIAEIVPGNIDMSNTDFTIEQPPAWINLSIRNFLMAKVTAVINDPVPSQKAMIRWAPRLAFALVPVYGLLLALMFFWRKKLYFYDHMIVALHFHAFLFFFLAVLIPTIGLISPAFTSVLFIGWSNYYLLQIHRKIYRCNWPTAILRTVILDTIYIVVLIISLFILLILGVLLA
ncbi:MAG: DUF3667 domain-containing protein [Robiginitomaculum sp.]|nr:DUF3667 domain-containing protein [Robiginitomaculum sp.]